MYEVREEVSGVHACVSFVVWWLGMWKMDVYEI